MIKTIAGSKNINLKIVLAEYAKHRCRLFSFCKIHYCLCLIFSNHCFWTRWIIARVLYYESSFLAPGIKQNYCSLPLLSVLRHKTRFLLLMFVILYDLSKAGKSEVNGLMFLIITQSSPLPAVAGCLKHTCKLSQRLKVD